MPFELGVILLFVYGAIIGSFLNVLILRLPAGQGINGRSHCMHCGHRLSAPDLFPVLSFLFLRGRCRYCRGRISPRYASIELVTGLLFALTWVVLGPSGDWAVLVRALFFVSVCIVVFVVDWEHYLILDVVVFGSLAALLALNVIIDAAAGTAVLQWSSSTVSGLLGAVAGSLPLFLIWLVSKGRWMGFGDVKLLLPLGAALGFPGVLVMLFIAFMLGGVAAIPLLALKRKRLESRVPFGTFLTAAAVIALFWGPALLGWYLALLGL